MSIIGAQFGQLMADASSQLMGTLMGFQTYGYLLAPNDNAASNVLGLIGGQIDEFCYQGRFWHSDGKHHDDWPDEADWAHTFFLSYRQVTDGRLGHKGFKLNPLRLLRHPFSGCEASFLRRYYKEPVCALYGSGMNTFMDPGEDRPQVVYLYLAGPERIMSAVVGLVFTETETTLPSFLEQLFEGGPYTRSFSRNEFYIPDRKLEDGGHSYYIRDGYQRMLRNVEEVRLIDRTKKPPQEFNVPVRR